MNTYKLLLNKNRQGQQLAFLSILIAILVLTIFESSCKKIIDIEPPVTSLTSGVVYQDDVTASSVVTGLYTKMMQDITFSSGLRSVTVLAGLSADELILWSGAVDNIPILFYKNSLSGTQYIGPWLPIYKYLHTVNSVLEGVAKSTALTPSVKQQIEGEAKFLRSFFYFYLVNLYGPVPLQTSSDWRINAVISRSSIPSVYQQIISDLKDAQNLLSSNYLASNMQSNTTERVRPTKWAATALLSKVYLYTGDWINAERQATTVIENKSIYDTVSLNNFVFNKNSKEAIWQLMPVNSNQNTLDGNLFILTSSPNANFPFYLSNSLLSAFEAGDKRKNNWIGSITDLTGTYYFPYKYKIKSGSTVSEYLTVLRLGEQYLIRAEARTQQGNISGAQADLNVIRTRAGLPNTSASDKISLLATVLHERQVELFAEWGNRWFDLKRSSNVDGVMSVITPQKANGVAWESYKQLLPLNADDIILNPNLTQNPGY
jgi:hypothetical protein